MVAEELATRLAKCELPADQKRLKRYRDVISVLWRGMQLDADAQMRRLNALRGELQSELLVSMSRKVNMAELRETEWFQKLDDGVKQQADAILEELNTLKKDIHNLDISAERRHAQLLRKLDKRPIAAWGGSSDAKLEKQKRIEKLCELLWFNGIPRRHHAIKPAHKETFEWVFTGQKTTAQSNTTLLEWMKDGNGGLYWVSGRAGTGKSCFFRFLDDDARTKLAFQEWAGERKLVLANFYFWNSEAANDDQLKSLSGLYRGILHSLIQQCNEFAEILFPDHILDGRSWAEASFPTTLDLDLAFNRLVRADQLPAAVGLMIDGLDEYDAESHQQMAMAKILRQAGESPHLKVIVSSRPESAFEATFRDSTKIRLHELTDQDRRNYTSDKLNSVARFAKIATPEEQLRLVNLIVQRSEGIFLWVYLVVETVTQEIDISLDIARLEKVVEDIPSGNKELSQVFDHIVRNRIPQEHRVLGYRLIQTLHYSYRLIDKVPPGSPHPNEKHMVTAVLLSFFEDDINSALAVPIGPLSISRARLRTDMTANLIRKACAGLLEARDIDPDDYDAMSTYTEDDPPVHFLHKDVARYLDHPDTAQFMERSLVDAKGKVCLHTNLLKCFVIMMKLYNPKSTGEQFLGTYHWDIWMLVMHSLRVSRSAGESGHFQDPEKLLDAMDNIMTKHYAAGQLSANVLGGMFSRKPIFIKPEEGGHWVSKFPVGNSQGHEVQLPSGLNEKQLVSSNFLSFSVEHGLARYVECKVRKCGNGTISHAGIPLLISACGNPCHWWLIKDSICSEIVKLLLECGADPNETVLGLTGWQTALWTAKFYQFQQLASFHQLANVLRLLLSAGADPDATIKWTRSLRDGEGNWETTQHARSAMEQIEITFIRGGADLQSFATHPWERLTNDELDEVADLGRDLLALLEEKRATFTRGNRANLPEGMETAPGTGKQRSNGNWRASLSRKTVVFKGCCPLPIRRKESPINGRGT